MTEDVRCQSTNKRLSDCPSLFKTSQGTPILHEIRRKVFAMAYKALQDLSYTQDSVLGEDADTNKAGQG